MLSAPRRNAIIVVILLVLSGIVGLVIVTLDGRPQSPAQWEPVIERFEGVPMVEVPPGCFRMGSEDGAEDETPVREVCFEAAFWIDQTEVTQADFTRLGGVKESPNAFNGDLRPVERITWAEARDFCALRGARLPTEREWEYAARGPDSRVYPWGDAWDEQRVVWGGNAGEMTADVGSRPAGASWVGALDMSGNVAEWISSLYLSYDSTEDREAAESSGDRVRRGGAWNTDDLAAQRSANRRPEAADVAVSALGFRCARAS